MILNIVMTTFLIMYRFGDKGDWKIINFDATEIMDSFYKRDVWCFNALFIELTNKNYYYNSSEVDKQKTTN